MKQRHRKRRKPVREDIPRGWTLIGVDYGAELVAALKGDPDNKGAHAAYNDIKRLIQGEIGEVFRTKIVPAPRLERAMPMPNIDPMTGQPWALPFHVRWISLDEAKALYPPVDPAPKPA